MNATKKARRAGRATPNGTARRVISAHSLTHAARPVNQPGTPIYAQGCVVGHVSGGTFYKTLRASVHFLKRPLAIAFDISTLFDAQEAGASKVEVTDAETGRVYVANIDDILRDGRRFNRGFGDQIYFLLSRWRSPDAPEQLSLFDAPPDEAAGDVREGLAAGPDASPMLSSAEPRPRVEGGARA